MGKEKQIKDLVDKINKSFGDGVNTMMSEKPKKFKGISSGSLKIDVALGGRFPSGRIVELYGNESCGKTGIALEAIAEVQKTGGNAAIIDVEHALNVELCEKIGVDISKLVISQPESAEVALEIAREYVKSGLFDIIVFDSVSALSPKSELNGEVGESKMGLVARLMGQALRMKLGVMYGNPETTTGGNALKFYASIRCEVKRSVKQDQGGFVQKIKVVKNKMAPAYKFVERFIHFDHGINKTSELIDVATDSGVIEKKGSWYNYGDVKLGQGLEKSTALLMDNPELQEEITNKVYEKLEL